jgi:uncharacterized protein YwgA
MNPIILGGILRNFYDDFDMTQFDMRLKIQKIIYLMKTKDMNLGYEFGLYLYGPYSVELTRDAFQISDLVKNFNGIDKITPTEKKEEFIHFILELEKDSRKDNPIWLEIVASYLFLKKMGYSNDEEIINRIKQKRPDFDIKDEDIKLIISEIKSGGFFV